MLKARYTKHTLKFRFQATTSRGVLKEKESWFIFLYSEKKPFRFGIGECSLFPGLSIDDNENFESKLKSVCESINLNTYDFKNRLYDYPSIQFGLEMALKDIENGGDHILFPSSFTSGKDYIPINGLIWMGQSEWMKEQITQKIAEGFQCIKIKIGALDLDNELSIIEEIRKNFPPEKLEIRVDANGAYSKDEVFEIINRLSVLDIHSIEQPILPGQLDEMAQLCKVSLIPVVLDEELLGVKSFENKNKLLEIIRPQYIVLKPSLLGGFKSCEEWIKIAKKFKIGWWITSALESNIGLNAITQWTYTLGNKLYHGLGTGQLYINNFQSPLGVGQGRLYHSPSVKWDLSYIL